MATILQLRRGTSTQHASFTGAQGEVTVDTTKKTIVVHDGSTQGGSPLATEAFVTTTLQTADSLAELSGDTDDITEGSTNLFFTNARARAAISVTGSGTYDSSTGVIDITGDVSSVNSLTGAVVLDTDDISEGTSNQYFTNARARSALSAGSGISYNSTTGAISADTSTMATKTYVDTAVAGKDNTDEITEGSTNLYFTNARARSALSAGTGISYNSTTGAISADTSTIATKTYVDTAVAAKDNTDEITEGSTNLYFTDARARGAVSVTDSGGDGSLAYNSTTGVITYTGPSAADVRAHFSAGTGITITSGQVAVDTSTIATKTYADSAASTAVAAVIDSAPAALDTLNELAAALGDDANYSTTVSTALGNRLRVDVDTQNLTSTQQGNALTNLGLTATKTELNYVDGVTSAIQTQLDAKFASADFNSTFDTRLGTKSTTNLTEGTNLYFTNARARSALSGGSGITYDSSTGAISADTSVVATKTYVDTAVAGKDNTDEITEGSTNLYFTNARARSAVSAGTGISYNSTTGVISADAASANTASKVVIRDASGNFSAGTITATLSGNASTVTNGVYTTDTGTVTNTMLAGSITNAKLVNSSITINGTAVSLGGSVGNLALTTGTLGQFAATTSSQLAGVISDETGSGALVFATSPTLVTPTLGAATATTINKVTITAPATGSTITIADGKTLTANNTLTFTGTDSSSVAFGAGGTVAYTANKLSAFAATTSAELAGVISDETGSGALVFANSPTFTGTANFAAISATGNASVGGNLTVTGDLTVNGTTTTINSTTISVDDKNIELGSVASPTDTTADGGGITLKGATDKTFNWVDATDAWTSSEHLALAAGKNVLLNGSTSGTITLAVPAAAGTNTVTLPATTGTVITTGDTGTVTNTMLAGSIANAKLANSTISGKALGTNLDSLTIGTGLSGTSYNGSAAVTIAIDSSVVTLTGTQTLTNKTLTSPTLTTPTLGVASATSINKVAITAPATSATLTIADGKTLTASNTLTFTGTDSSSIAFGAGGTVAYTSNKLSAFAATSSSELAGVISDETGSGALVFANSPTLVTPALGTPSSVTLTNATGLPVSTGISGLGTGVATFLATPSSANLASAVTDETGSGALVFATAPALSAPTVSTNAAVTAAGTTQGTATAVTADYVVATTVASGTGVVLPAGTAGRRIVLVNKGANTLTIYPASGGTIDALAANAGIQLAANGTIELMASSSTQWYSIARVAIFDSTGTLLN